MMHDFVSQIVEIDKAALEVLEGGSGSVIFYCTHPYIDTTGPHPGGGLTEALADAGRTFYIAPRATGNSAPEARATKLGMHQTVDDVESVRQALGIDRWVAAGMSTGAMTAVEYALRYPNSVVGLISVGGSASWRFLEDPRCIYNPEHPDAWREIEARNALDGSEDANKRWLRTVLELSLYKTELLEYEVENFNISPARLARVREELIGTWDREDDLHTISVPTLVMCGRHDTQAPISASELIADRVPNARMVVFEESNHFPFDEEPDAFRAAIAEFAAELAGTRR